MSYEIEDRYVAFAFDGRRAYQRMKALAEAMGVGQQWWFPDYGPTKCYAVFCEHGSSNTVERNTNRLARGWGLQYVGPGSDVMERVIDMARYVERGLTKPFGRGQHAEAYIAAARKRMKEAVPFERISRSGGARSMTLSLHTPIQEKLASHPWWTKAFDDGRLTVVDDRTLVRCDLLDSEALECDLLAIGQVSDGTCATEASMERYSSFAVCLDQMAREAGLLANAA